MAISNKAFLTLATFLWILLPFAHTLDPELLSSQIFSRIFNQGTSCTAYPSDPSLGFIVKELSPKKMLTFSCKAKNRELYLTGPKYAVCVDLLWSHPLPVCAELGCNATAVDQYKQNATDVRFKVIEENSTPIGYALSCAKGLTLDGSDLIYCNNNAWRLRSGEVVTEMSLPSCRMQSAADDSEMRKREDRKELGRDYNFHVIKPKALCTLPSSKDFRVKKLLGNRIVKFIGNCPAGSRLTGRYFAVCIDQQWSNALPVCAAIAPAVITPKTPTTQQISLTTQSPMVAETTQSPIIAHTTARDLATHANIPLLTRALLTTDTQLPSDSLTTSHAPAATKPKEVTSAPPTTLTNKVDFSTVTVGNQHLSSQGYMSPEHVAKDSTSTGVYELIDTTVNQTSERTKLSTIDEVDTSEKPSTENAPTGPVVVNTLQPHNVTTDARSTTGYKTTRDTDDQGSVSDLLRDYARTTKPSNGSTEHSEPFSSPSFEDAGTTPTAPNKTEELHVVDITVEVPLESEESLPGNRAEEEQDGGTTEHAFLTFEDTAKFGIISTEKNKVVTGHHWGNDVVVTIICLAVLAVVMIFVFVVIYFMLKRARHQPTIHDWKYGNATTNDHISISSVVDAPTRIDTQL